MDGMPLIPNQVMQVVSNNRMYRILWVTPENSTAYWICLSTSSNIPQSVSVQHLLDGISKGEFTLCPEPYSLPYTISQVCAERRDRAWSLISEAVSREPEIYMKHQRAEILQSIVENSGVKLPRLYRYLGLYWRGGMVPNALVPTYENCGKTDPLSNPEAHRRGRKKVEGAEGKLLTAKDTQIFSTVIQRYYMDKKQSTLEDVFKNMLREYYSVRDEDGNLVSLLPPDDIPSRSQFLYWHRKNKDVLAEAVARNGERKFNLENRASLGRTETYLSGPCALCQIDATIGDIFLVRQDDRTAIVGRPTLYFLKDAFTRMVVGMHVTLSPPSWSSASMCILNALEDKVQYCKKYGVTITEEDWPCRHAPSTIRGDRGEMESAVADMLQNELRIAIENTPPYRGDLKGIIEQHFHLINLDLNNLPGKMSKDYGERCTEDYRLDATLDIREFTQIIIHCVLQYNNYHYMEYYTKTSHMRQCRVKPVPRDLWNYGLRYRTGGLRVVDSVHTHYTLLPKGIGSITPHGIAFEGLYYACEKAISEKWFASARTTECKKITLSYDPEDLSRIFIRPDLADAPLECTLLEGNNFFEPLSAEEIKQRSKMDKEERERHRIIEDEFACRNKDTIDEIVQKAEQKKPDNEKSKRERIQEIAENRRQEIEACKANKKEDQDDQKEIDPALQDGEGGKDDLDPLQQILQDALAEALEGEEK